MLAPTRLGRAQWLFVSRATQHLARLWICKMKSLAGGASHALIGFPAIVRLVVVHPALHLKASGRTLVKKCSHVKRIMPY